ncbi:hypothetical protein BV22DRAFT_1047491 [Leucogyrophana mollusca]|uniref:Uncharacterized protein n=1 Tax=Leucogyrophana mollusca TaxID=85980 RepID=A0ACB8BGD0_9AGAM|nr:hypothetical protein BV22DRAFT_1047491 [Leucogyrophana mollusca]
MPTQVQNSRGGRMPSGWTKEVYECVYWDRGGVGWGDESEDGGVGDDEDGGREDGGREDGGREDEGDVNGGGGESQGSEGGSGGAAERRPPTATKARRREWIKTYRTAAEDDGIVGIFHEQPGPTRPIGDACGDAPPYRSRRVRNIARFVTSDNRRKNNNGFPNAKIHPSRKVRPTKSSHQQPRYQPPENLEDHAVTRDRSKARTRGPYQGDPGKPGGQTYKGKSISITDVVHTSPTHIRNTIRMRKPTYRAKVDPPRPVTHNWDTVEDHPVTRDWLKGQTREPHQGDPGKPGGHQAHKGKSISITGVVHTSPTPIRNIIRMRDGVWGNEGRRCGEHPTTTPSCMEVT